MPRMKRPRRLFRNRPGPASITTEQFPADIREALASHPAPDLVPLLARYFSLGQDDPEFARVLYEMVRRTADIGPGDDRFWWEQSRLWLGGLHLNRPRSIGDLETARGLASEVLTVSPGSADAHFLHAAADVQLGAPGARQRLSVALAMMTPDGPNYVDACHADALLRLREGDFSAWAEYGAWLDRLNARPRACLLPSPRWNGEPLDGRTILLHTVQDGDGDAIQMARYVRIVKAMGADVTIVTSANLASLFAHMDGVDRVIVNGAAVPADVFRHDYHAPLMALPPILTRSLETIPSHVPYVRSSDEAIERWRPIIEAIPGRIRVGVCWQGNPEHRSDAFRSYQLAELAPLAAVPGVTLVSLQKNAGADQLVDVPFPITSLGPDYAAGDWLDTAAIVGHLDLVIAPDTSIGHVAGALGNPAWLALARPSEWRWMDDRPDSPWYPTMRLFRQDRPGDWSPLFARMADRLATGWARGDGGRLPEHSTVESNNA